jgi:hypothetical protein
MQQVEIRVKGVIDKHWSEWLGGLAIRHDSSGGTVITGQVADPAALYGIIGRLRDLGLQLCWLNCKDLCEHEVDKTV